MRPHLPVMLVVASLLGACTTTGTDSNDVPPSVIDTSRIAFDTEQTIKPTAIILHWWAGRGKGADDIGKLISTLRNSTSTYNPKLTKKDDHPVVGPLSVQVGVTWSGKAWQLTPKLNSWARHAKCGNEWGIGIEIEGFGPGHRSYIGNNAQQFEGVVAVVKELMALFDIPAESFVAEDGRSGRGIVSHRMVDKKCKWADKRGRPGKGAYAGSGKVDVDDKYLNRVLDAVK